MIELVLAERCTRCGVCVEICPTNVFDAVAEAPPVIARRSDCATCFMCELYCRADALFVGADCERPEGVSAAEVLEAGWLGQFRRDSGWDEWAGDPRYRNQHWRMDGVFARARQAEARGSEAVLPSSPLPPRLVPRVSRGPTAAASSFVGRSKRVPHDAACRRYVQRGRPASACRRYRRHVHRSGAAGPGRSRAAL